MTSVLCIQDRRPFRGNSRDTQWAVSRNGWVTARLTACGRRCPERQNRVRVLLRATAVTLLMAGSVSVSLAGCGVVKGNVPGGGRTAVSYTGYGGPVLLSADRRTITVAGFSYPCFGTLRPIARETKSRVGLWLKYVTPVGHGACNASMAMEGPRHIRLIAPLGSRLLADGATGRALHWFDARKMLRPSDVPAGYKLQAVTPDVMGSRDPPPAPGCEQDYRSGNATLSIIQSTGTLQLPYPGSHAPAPIRVRGHAGFGSAYGIVWREGGYNVMIEAIPGTGTAAVLPARTLIAIADSAPPA